MYLTCRDPYISIHAPVKGATRPAGDQAYDPTDFNPRSREGSDAVSARAAQMWLYFNPRSREGSDFLMALGLIFPWISIHAPVKGATSVKFVEILLARISIHAPVKGATVMRLMSLAYLQFQSTLP